MVVLQCYSIPVIKHAVAALQRSSTAASIAAAQRFSVPFRMQRSALQRCSVQCCSECAASQCAAFQQCSVQQCSVQRCSAEHCSLHCRMQRSALQCAAPQRHVAALQCADAAAVLWQCCNAATLQCCICSLHTAMLHAAHCSPAFINRATNLIAISL